jgi:hypothetical protein
MNGFILWLPFPPDLWVLVGNAHDVHEVEDMWKMRKFPGWHSIIEVMASIRLVDNISS